MLIRNGVCGNSNSAPLQRTNCAQHPAPDSCSDLLGLGLFLVIIVIVVLLVLLGLLVGFGFLGIVLFLLLGLLEFAESLPLLGEAIGLRNIIGDDDVVEDGSSLHLPQIKSDEAEIIELVDGVVILILGVGDLLGLPDALVCRVANALDVPLTLVSWIVLHGSLPLAILLVIPIIRLGGVSIHNPLLICPIIWLLVLWVIHHGIIHPIGGFLVVWVVDLLWLQHLPILLDGALVDLLLINFNPNCIVGLDNQSVQVRGALALLLVRQIRLLQNIFALVSEDQVRPFCVPTLVRSEHDVVHSGIAELGCIVHFRAQLDVAASALHILLVLGLVLDNQILVCIAEGIKAGRNAEELGILAGLDALILGLVVVPFACACDPLAGGSLAVLPLAHCPPVLPARAESLRKQNLAAHKAHRSDAH